MRERGRRCRSGREVAGDRIASVGSAGPDHTKIHETRAELTRQARSCLRHSRHFPFPTHGRNPCTTEMATNFSTGITGTERTTPFAAPAARQWRQRTRSPCSQHTSTHTNAIRCSFTGRANSRPMRFAIFMVSLDSPCDAAPSAGDTAVGDQIHSPARVRGDSSPTSNF
jgi:hypothetical protein